MAGTATRTGSVAAVAVLGVAGIVLVLRATESNASPKDTAREYLAAWEDGDTKAMEELVADPPATFAATYKLFDPLEVEKAEFDLGAVSVSDNEAIATFDASLTLANAGDWTYEGSLQLQRTSGDKPWKVNWAPSSIHPQLVEGVALEKAIVPVTRAPILDKDGQPLAQSAPGKRIGIHPRRVVDMNQVKAALQTTLGIDPLTIDTKLTAPGVQPDHFVEVATVTSEVYEQIKPIVYPVIGIEFRDEPNVRATPSQGFAAHIIGRTGEITAERLTELGAPYKIGDIVGLTGLEARFEKELTGTPSWVIRMVDNTDPDNPVPAGDLGTIEGSDPTPITTTLDADIQLAVENALVGVATPAAVVVVDSKGNIRAAASRPIDEFNRAFAGSYPPGSTFKIVTTSALLDAGTTPETPLDCPETLNAGGRIFKNFESSSLGTVPFLTAFAESCNTAFINATSDMPAADLAAAARNFGFNAEYSVGLTTEGGSFPDPADNTEKAAASIGQGRVLASPLHMATVAAAVIDGSWEPPVLLPDVPAENPPASTQLSPAALDTLPVLMRRVVTDGSGRAAAVPGADVAGKTGTAEFGSGDPLPTHAWFVGFKGDLAIAVLLEGGGVGGRDAAPVAGRVLTALPNQ
jgi:cell division protein FtsI/penicillin-binding protein 2